MRLLDDNIPLPKEFPLQAATDNIDWDVPPMLHRHECFELNLIKSGEGSYKIGDADYVVMPGDIYVINNNEYHYSCSVCGMKVLTIIFNTDFIWPNSSFDYEYLKPFLERRVYFHNRIESGNPGSPEIGSLMLEIESEFQQEKTGYKLIIKSLLMKILALLYRHFKLEGELDSRYLEKQHSFERIRNAVSYVEENYTNYMDFKYIAQLAYMNPTYFSAYFKKVMHQNLTDYIISLRVNNAAKLLKRSTKSITEICDECGFCSLSHFNRTFRKLTGLSPSQYRFTAKSKTQLDEL